MRNVAIVIRGKLAFLFTLLTLSATPTLEAATTPVDQRINSALASGNPSGLQSEDAARILERATDKAKNLRWHQRQILRDIYNATGTVPDLTLNVGAGSSSPLSPSGATRAIAYLVSDDGTGMAAVSEFGPGRALAYGADVMNWMAGTTKEQQHFPLFTRAFTWAMTGHAGGGLPDTIRFAQSGYSANSVKNYVARLGKQTQEVSCDIASAANTCWQDLDLLVFGQATPDHVGLSNLVRNYLAAGKPVIYMNGGWWTDPGSVQVLQAMGMRAKGEPGNYFASAPTYSVTAGRTVNNNLGRADKLAKLLTTLQLLSQSSYTQDFNADPTAIDGVNQLRGDLSSYETGGQRIFKSRYAELPRLLVLWADLWRHHVVYGQLNRTTDSANFLRAFASDAWVAYNRNATSTNPGGQGDFMPAAAQLLATTGSYQTIEITLPQGSGKTAIGRGAVPAKLVSVKIAGVPAGVRLGLQTGYLRTNGNPLKDSYSRPYQPNSWTVPLTVDDTLNTFVSPSGGPLFLSYSGAIAGQKIRLRIKGVVKYAHFDFSNGTPSQQTLDEAMAALQRDDYGWSTAKFHGGETQQTISSARSSMGDLTPQQLYQDRIESILMDTNHMANGYNDMPLSPTASTLCTTLGWDCSASVHKAPSVQHFVSWLAACGSGCSGQPIDTNNWGLDTGWGWAHELGHNTVQRWMHIVLDGKGCDTECDNNTLSTANMMRRYAELGEDDSGDRTDYAGLYQMIQANRGTGLAGEAQRADMQQRLWGGSGQNPMRAMYFELAFLYTKVRHNLAKPTADTSIEFLALLSKGGRLVDSTWTAETAASYGMSRYTSKSISNHELFYVLGSRIIGQDLRNYFSMYGIPLSQTALDSVADLALPTASLQFYALGAGKSNQLSTGQWLSLQGQTPAYPF